jgi:hypothetical protein
MHKMVILIKWQKVMELKKRGVRILILEVSANIIAL